MWTLRRLTTSVTAVAVMVAAQVLPSTHAWVPHIIVKGNKFFDSETGKEFRMKGMAYYPRPNAGELYEVDNYDWAADEHEAIWSEHLELLKDAGVNTIRLYSVDPSKPHDKFMCACSEAGIYVLVGMAAPCKDCAIPDAVPPACYPDGLFTRAQMVYNSFAVYDNTLGFSVGNENNLQMQHGNTGTTTAPCVKAFLRDVRRYAMSCAGSMRPVPIGLDIADIPPRDQWIKYYDCPVKNEEFTRAEWIGFNPYVECDPLEHKEYEQSEGLKSLMKEYATVGFARPLMFGEFGCNLGKNTINGYESQRTFHDAKWMNEEEEMMAEIVGGNVFEFSTERNHVKDGVLGKASDPGKYGVGYFDPKDCDHDKIPCTFVPYPEFKNLKKAYTSTAPSNLTLKSYKKIRKGISECPASISTDLPPMPKVENLKCSTRQPVCKKQKSNAFDKDASQVVALGKTKPPSNTSPEADAPLKNSHSEKHKRDQASSSERPPLPLGPTVFLALFIPHILGWV